MEVTVAKRLASTFASLATATALLTGCSDEPANKGFWARATPSNVVPQPPRIPGPEPTFEWARQGDRVFFEFDKSTVKPEGRDQLRKWVAFLNKYWNDKLLIEGHADERGTREYNLALGQRRANAVKEFLIAQGVDPSRLSTISYGKERPAVLGSNEAVWAQNRRAVGVIR